MRSKKMTKFTALALVAAMGVSVLAGCGNNSSSSTTAASGDSTTAAGNDANATTAAGDAADSTTVAGDDNQTAGEAATKTFDSQVEIQIPVYDRATDGAAPVDDNYWTQWIQKEFGDKYNIKVKYVAIPRADEVTKFNMLIASGEAPNIIFHYDYPAAINYYQMGALKEINVDLLKQYAPTYYNNMVNTTDSNGKSILEYGQVDGKQIFIAARRPDAYNFVTLIRKDWLDDCGLEVPTTREEYIEVLKAFKENNCGGEGTTIPATAAYPTTGYVAGNYGFRDYPLDEEELALYSDLTVASLSWEPTKEFLKFQNELYNEGLISSEYYMDTDGTKAKAQFTSGKAGVYGCYLSKGDSGVIESLLANCPDAEVALLPASVSFSESQTAYPERAYWPFGMIIGINQDSTEDEEIATYMLLEWMSQEDNLFTLQNGIEGVTYTLDDNGLPVLVDGYTGEERLNYNSNKDMYCLVIEGKDYGSEEKNLLVQETTYAPEGYEYIIEDRYNEIQANKKDWYTDHLFSTAITSVTEYAPTLLAKWQEYSVKLTTCKPEEFDALYDQYCKDYLDSGYQQILDDRKAALEAE